MTDFLPHVYGQEKVKKEWKRLLEERRLPHTMILYGDEGLGKTTAAFDLAGVLTGKSEKLWEEIRLWQRESSGKEPVVTFADHQVWYLCPTGMELKIEQFRLFLDAMATFDETVHVCIIDEAQTMMDPVANSLLKTLEEPEGNIHFILITHDLHALLPTIIPVVSGLPSCLCRRVTISRSWRRIRRSITSRREWMRRCSSSFRKEIRGSRWRSVMKRERQSHSRRWISGIS